MNGEEEPTTLQAWAPAGIPEVRPGDDLATLIGDALTSAAESDPDKALRSGDILSITSKIVSKAEGRVWTAEDREEAITEQTVRVVATRRHADGSATRIVENRIGIVQAAAGVDASNTPPGTVLLLPRDPDASARALRAALQKRFGVLLGVLITDTLGRPWRLGQTDAAIGAAGLAVLHDLRGLRDGGGRLLMVTAPAVADEIAALSDLVKGKAGSRPVAVVRGLASHVTRADGPGARALLRRAEDDLFRLGTDEAYAAGFEAGRREAAAPAEAPSDRGVAPGIA
jgi:coenzyme F420-0:L-glutamate ligase/coenzyme F420-1:gamma-L-glutamate ligase